MAVPMCHKMHPVHIIALNFEYPLIFDVPVIVWHKTLKHLLPYLLLVHVVELVADSFLPFSARFFIGILGFDEHLGLFQVWFSVD